MVRYPLPKDKVRSYTGKKLDQIEMDDVLRGNVVSDDIKISKETLHLQGEVAKVAGKSQIKENFDRAGELTKVEDALILEIYDKLRPHRATKEELLGYANRLDSEYGASECATFIRDAVGVYERRGILRRG